MHGNARGRIIMEFRRYLSNEDEHEVREVVARTIALPLTPTCRRPSPSEFRRRLFPSGETRKVRDGRTDGRTDVFGGALCFLATPAAAAGERIREDAKRRAAARTPAREREEPCAVTTSAARYVRPASRPRTNVAQGRNRGRTAI